MNDLIIEKFIKNLEFLVINEINNSDNNNEKILLDKLSQVNRTLKIYCHHHHEDNDKNNLMDQSQNEEHEKLIMMKKIFEIFYRYQIKLLDNYLLINVNNSINNYSSNGKFIIYLVKKIILNWISILSNKKVKRLNQIKSNQLKKK